MSSTYGKIFSIHTFGESHGRSIGVVIDGCPAGIEVGVEDIQKELDRRKPGQSEITTQRKEGDKAEILSGIFEGKTLGSPIGLLINNADAKSKDYEHIKDTFRPSHADFTYETKYGLRDYRGGGRSSARETVARVAAGAVAKKMLQQVSKVQISAFVHQVGDIKVEKHYSELDLSQIESNMVRCPDSETATKMIERIEQVRDQGNTIGGVVLGLVKNMPVGLGEPVFDKLHAELGKAMLSINAVKGFEIGSGFDGVQMLGSEHNDQFIDTDGNTKTNHSGGVQGGISNGQDLYFRVAFKPVATIMQDQDTIDKDGKKVTIEGKGRHDPCVLPRAVPIVDAMTALVLADFWLRNKLSKIGA